MKKIMMFIAVALAAVLTQAATVKWSTGTIYGVDADGNWTTTKAYADGGAYSIAIKLFAADGSTLLEEASSTTVSSLSAMTGTFTGDYAFSTTHKVSIQMTYKGESGIEQTMDWTTPVEFTTKATGGTTANFTSLGIMSSAKFSEASGTPEPTSGMLLLLGGAMLALRRKQRK